METITKTDLDLPLIHKGKVREMYDYEGDKILMVATDRISAFDVVFNEGIPYKGAVLSTLSQFWFNKTQHIIPNHVITTQMPENLPNYLDKRAVIVKKAKPLKIEVIVRGYLTGSGFKDYKKTGMVCGIKLPEGMKDGDKFPEPIFTPSTKAQEGHDQNITEAEAAEIIGQEKLAFVKKKCIELYQFGHDYLLSKGLILADTKFEFGELPDGPMILIDEVLTPDSSRYWPKDQYEQGNLVSLDKQYLRNYLETLDWGKTYPPPTLPPDVVQEVSNLYLDVYEKITGERFPTD
ncbi:phosphoribosylaminoimidazolesuccinocarboxamide synthase [Candidatus Micrarchaeota archaeon]|nr:phosphoribosylaminoimidazolesuccinocarboxamide synthase [Candidatus Micrarchaeota archaeon]MBD3418164.1 phosphoribosylaminoimidazolesuccinocarboxamide synthase [Candidatus Micrarchaeota archaeon]